jgi:polynucleotide 5'-hydroxyl-kinase GRC3/NOL9
MTASVKGPKGSGKSTFTRMLVNRLLLRHKQVAYLDCDTGQTEFTPPGMVSLHILSEPIHGEFAFTPFSECF